MATKQDDDQIRQYSSKNVDDKNKYKKYDTDLRNRVIFWSQFTMFLVAASVCVASFTVPILRKSRPRGIAMWQWSLLVTVLLGGPLISQALVHFVRLFLDDLAFSAKENVIYYVLGIIKSAWVGLWFTMVLIAWLIVVEEPSYLGMPYEEGEKIIEKFNTTYPIIKVTLITMIMGSFLWLLKDLGLMKAKSTFHIRRFFDRIREALMHQCIIERLSSNLNVVKELEIDKENCVRIPCFDQVSAKKFSCWGMKTSVNTTYHNQNNNMVTEMVNKEENFCRRIKSGNKNKKTVVNVSCLNDLSQETVSCWGMKQVINLMMEKENQYWTYDFKYSFDELMEMKKIETEDQAKKFADDIFNSLFDEGEAQDHNSQIVEAKLGMYFPDQEERRRAEKCLREGAGAEKINREVFKKWMVKALRERLSLVRALVANKTLFRALNRFINVLLVFMIFALWLIMIRVETRKIIFVGATAIAGSAFIFGETCKKILENLLFVFLVHPFDVGDCCLIDDTPVIIEEISVLSTTAMTFENEIRHYPNATLAGQTISNYTRSKHMGDSIEFLLDSYTLRSAIDDLKKQVESYVQKNKHWYSDLQWNMEFGNDNKLKMTLHFQHSINYHDFWERQSRRSNLVSETNEILNTWKSILIN